MKKLLLFLCAISLLLGFSGTSGAYLISISSDVALTGASVIDFESETIDTYTSLTIGEVTFIAGNNFLGINDSWSGNYNTTGLCLENTSSGFDSITFSFSSALAAFGFNWGASDKDWVLEAYDAGNALIESCVLPLSGASNDGDFYGIAAANIAYATLYQTTQVTVLIDHILIDNFTYVAGAEPVPEPATMLLLGSGLLGLAGFRRRFKRQHIRK